MEKTDIKITGMHCESCVRLIEKTLGKADGIESAVVNFAAGKASVTYDPAITEPARTISKGA